MRLSNQEITIIKQLAKRVFGKDTHVYLFGSRTSDDSRGGDIDLLITHKDQQKLTFSAKKEFLAELKTRIGDQKIDVVLDTKTTQSKKNFYQSIHQQAVKL
ncbi:MAG: nucleotidyltransferase domain-containing protein [Bacteroidales bacterium]|nr:nucleotidyltransferase domain-containing protein [Bacteroidales bacterium]MCF8337168.1 nucleotidyltransferase domain-containing protein [Bacteroidales bacterium]